MKFLLYLLLLFDDLDKLTYAAMTFSRCDGLCLWCIYLVGMHPKFLGTTDSSRRGVKVAMRSNTWRIVAPVAD